MEDKPSTIYFCFILVIFIFAYTFIFSLVFLFFLFFHAFFFTIFSSGGWSILANMLHPSKHPEQQAMAAWAMGTAVKNSYDFQLWMLESDYSHPSVLSLKKNKKVYVEGGSDSNTGGISVSSGSGNSIGVESIDSSDNVKTIDSSKNDRKDDKINLTSMKKERKISHAVTLSSQNDTDIQHNNNVKKSNKNDENGGSNNNDNGITDAEKIKLEKNSLFSDQNVTGLQKLVSLLIWSDYLQNRPDFPENLNFFMSNYSSNSSDIKPNFDELQRKVFYAISSGARGNVEVQESLLKIRKNDLYRISDFMKGFGDSEIHGKNNENDDNDNSDNDNNDEDSNDNDSNNINNIDNSNDVSPFLAYITKIAENETETKKNRKSKSVSYDMLRKIWTFISDMLEERYYIRVNLPLLSELSEESVNQLSSLNLFGDLFLNEKWLNLSVLTFFELYTVLDENTEIVTDVDINVSGEIGEIGNIVNTETIDISSKRTIRALLKNVLMVIKEVLTQEKKLVNYFLSQIALDESFTFLLDSIIEKNDVRNEGIIEEAKSISLLLKSPQETKMFF